MSVTVHVSSQAIGGILLSALCIYLRWLSRHEDRGEDIYHDLRIQMSCDRRMPLLYRHHMTTSRVTGVYDGFMCSWTTLADAVDRSRHERRV